MSNFIEIVHRVSSKLTDINDEEQIYQVMNDGMKQISPGAAFVITKLQPDDMNFRIVYSSGLTGLSKLVRTLVGKDLFQMDFPFSDLSDEKRKEFESRKLHHCGDGIYEITNGRLNKTICKTIEKLLGISEVYAISFCIDKKYFGGATFYFPKSVSSSGRLSKDIILTIESLAFQVSFAINRLRDFDALKSKRNELKIAQSKFNQLVNQLNDIVWVAKEDGEELIDLNNSFEKYSGYSPSQFKENPHLWSDIIYPEDKAVVRRSNEELAISGNSKCEYRVVTADGSIIWLRERKSILYDDSGKPIQMGGVASNITEKKLLEEQLRLKDYALENSPNAIAFADLEGYITYVNRAYIKLFGYDDIKEILGKPISDFSSAINKNDFVSDTLKNGKVCIKNDQPKRKDGTSFHSITLASSVKHEQETACIMVVFIDITELREMEVSLKKSEAQLSKSNKEKDKFFAIIAHDLRSPFNGMLGLLELLFEDYKDYSDEERLDLIKISHEAAQKAFSLLLDLLEWARLQTNSIEIKTEIVDLHTVVQENINIYSNQSEVKGIIIKNSIDQSTEMKIDLNSINTLVRNLLMNAIKFTRKDGSIVFTCKELNDKFELSIRDTGVGMGEETRTKLFKLDENITMLGTNNEKGTGLGLLICNEIAVKNSWKIDVESQLGVGSTFRIVIPKN